MLTFRRAVLVLHSRSDEHAGARGASRRARELVLRARREALALLSAEGAVIALGIAAQLVFVLALLAVGARWLEPRRGVLVSALSLGGYGASLLLGLVGARRQRRSSPRGPSIAARHTHEQR